MGDLRSKLRAKISRRNSGVPSLPSSANGNNSSLSGKSIEPSSPVSGHRFKFGGGTASPTSPGSFDGSPLSRETTGLSDRKLTVDAKQNHGQPKLGQDSNAGQRALINGNVVDVVRVGTGSVTSTGAGAQSVVVQALDPKSPTNNNNPGPSQLGNNDGQGSVSGRHSLTANTQLSPIDTVQTAATTTATATATAPTPTDEIRSRISIDAVRRLRLTDDPLPTSLSRSGSSTSRPPATTVVSSRPSSSTYQDVGVDPTIGGPAPPSSHQLRSSSSASYRPSGPPRRQSLLPHRQTTLIRTLLDAGQPDDLDHSDSDHLLPISATMATRKLWVKRPGGSATLVTINEEDLVDDVRELILRKYANTLGRQYDAPDLTLRILPREGQRQERVLGPEEPMARTLDAYFPGGQVVDEALLIDVPHRRHTPRASPRNGPPHAQHLTSVGYDDIRPLEASTDYFGPGAVAHIPVAALANAANGTTHAISVLNTGQVPQIPSPGATTRQRQYRERSDRPRIGRQHTSSPTILNVVGAGGHTATIAVAANHGMAHAASIPRSRTHSNASSEQTNPGQGVPPAPPPLPTPPSQDPAAVVPIIPRTATPPPVRPASPRAPIAARPKKKKTVEAPALPAGMLNGGVPPINVLIVEDNIINLRLLEAFVKRLKVRWQTAMNGREAVNKWRTGGFHLVLMDIQLPVMSGLEATREIRRLERTNSIGAFSTTTNGNVSVNGGGSDTTGDGEPDETKGEELPEEDKLQNRDMFKSPVIIVALTASSLQSDRHEALAAGCNDFLTKPVTYVWLERKVMEWGCMQALIDYDGWRKWKSFTSPPPKLENEDPAAKKTRAKRIKTAPNSSSSDGQ
ncbi:uncharacterized protein C8A04DRAFT_12279 [Dichotomopilus funicola]|uniref:Response regulatory domain-containing protein n=1 Tax=Dichotomopilus funicola TaxID=1934379 RepID=A0AAN6V2C0_9PEZI|nr:hypothetical protein C8A04DRAFT_12279 [Dichotomopilus funicola]